MQVEVVREHEGSKAHRDSEAAHNLERSVSSQGGFFAKQATRRDEAVITAMRTLLWLVKENVALEKWNSLKGKKFECYECLLPVCRLSLYQKFSRCL